MICTYIYNFHNKFIETYEFDLAHFLLAPELAWQVHLKKTEILKLLTDIVVVEIVGKRNQGCDMPCNLLIRKGK